MEIPQPMPERPARTSRTPLIIAAAVILLCCCSLVIVGAIYYGFTAIRSAETQVIPSIQDDILTPSALGEPPAGGLANDILRNDTWQYVAAASIGHGCDEPVGEDSTIEVVHQLSDTGVWVEKWTVVCRSGATYEYEVEYILDDASTTFNIRSLP